jgi:hypothetical protein
MDWNAAAFGIYAFTLCWLASWGFAQGRRVPPPTFGIVASGLFVVLASWTFNHGTDTDRAYATVLMLAVAPTLAGAAGSMMPLVGEEE